MTVFRKIGAALLSAAVILCCGCTDNSRDRTGAVSSEKNSSTASEVAFTVPDGSLQGVDSGEITYFGSKNIDSVSALYTKQSGGTVLIERVGVSNYTDALSEKISADNSPDLCDKIDNTFPYLMSMNLYEDLTNYIDTTSPQWLEYTDIVERYSFKGARYFYPTTVTVMPEFLIYVKTKYIQNGNLPDPEKQWAKNEWTWGEFVQGAEGILGSSFGGEEIMISGSEIFNNFFATTGAPIFLQEGNRFYNNLESGNAYWVYDFLMPYELKYTDVTDAESGMTGAVFLSGDERTLAELRRTDLAIGVVPYPRCEFVDEYYCKAVAEGFLVPKGAKNIQSAASFINHSRIADASEEQQEMYDKNLVEIGLLRSDVEWLRDLRSSDMMTPVLIDINCFDQAANAAANSLMTYRGDYAWDVLLAEYAPTVDSAIESINAVIE